MSNHDLFNKKEFKEYMDAVLKIILNDWKLSGFRLRFQLGG
jgi:hypothetical protein